MILICSCKRNVLKEIPEKYTGEIIGTAGDCNICLLKIESNNSGIKRKLGNSIGNLYYALNIPENKVKIGQKLHFEINTGIETEKPLCLQYGPAYSCINIKLIDRK